MPARLIYIYDFKKEKKGSHKERVNSGITFRLIFFPLQSSNRHYIIVIIEKSTFCSPWVSSERFLPFFFFCGWINRLVVCLKTVSFGLTENLLDLSDEHFGCMISAKSTLLVLHFRSVAASSLDVPHRLKYSLPDKR